MKVYISVYCRRGEVPLAEELANEHDLWCAEVGGQIIAAHMRKGQLDAAHDVLKRIGISEISLALPLQDKSNLADRKGPNLNITISLYINHNTLTYMCLVPI